MLNTFVKYCRPRRDPINCVGRSTGHSAAAAVASRLPAEGQGKQCNRDRVGWRTSVTAPLWPLTGLRFCLISTLDAGGELRATVARFALDRGRVFVRAPVTSDLASRVWRSSKLTITPCSPRGRVLGAPIDVAGHVIADVEEATAESALAAGDGRIDRLRLWLERRRGGDTLYLEIAPAEGDPLPPGVGAVTALPR
jgi:hypothetical protein